MRTSRFSCLLSAAVMLISLSTTGSAHAQRSADGVSGAVGLTEADPVMADFEGQSIDLAKGWGAAQACIVWSQGGVVECFRTDEELDARARALAPKRREQADARPPPPETTSSGATAAGSWWSWCSSALDLYDQPGYGGRRLSYWDRGFWQNLGLYGFNDRVSSYITGGCQVYMAEHYWGGGAWYPGYTGPYYPSSSMYPGWDNQVSSIYIA